MTESLVTEPTFVHHDTGPILSIDCHPSGNKFITCGQKSTSSKGMAVVWNMEAVLDKNKALDENVPKVLFQLDSESQFNTVRWSPDGKRFAAGCDDSSVWVFEYVGRINSQGFIGGSKNVERYKECCILRGHRMEVLSVEWSPNGRFLASGSIDYRIIIYNARKLPQQVAVLSDCELPVKGLSWDPIGKYLASLEGDKKLRFWTTDTWQCVNSVTEPFATSIEETLLSRLDWSPDGKYLMTPAAVQKGQHLIRLIQRKSWKSDQFLAGHFKGTTCVRAMPRLVDVNLKNGKKMQMTCCAVGSRDKSISIWVFPGAVKPILVLDNLFHHTVMDFAWCGRNLLVCSADGSIRVISLSESLIGEMVSKEAMSDLCHSIYSIRPPQYEQEAMEEGDVSQDSFSVAPVASSAAAASTSFITCPEEVLARRKQQEQAQQRSTAVPALASSSSTTTTTTTTTKPSTTTTNPTENPKENDSKAKEKQMLEDRKEQKLVVEAGGKRRFQPVFCGAISADEPPVAPTEPPAKKPVVPAPPPPKKRIALAPAAPDDVDLEEDSSGNDSDEEDEEEDESDAESSRAAAPTMKKTTENRMLAMDLKKPVLRPMEPKSLQTKEGTVLMEAPEQQPKISQHVQERKGMFVEVDNRWKHAGVETTQVKLVKKKQEVVAEEELMDGEERRMILECLWMTVVGAPVIIVAANKHHVTLGCGDKCLRVYRTLCGSLLSSLRLDSLPVLIGVKEAAAYALTENGRLSTWNLKQGKAVVTRQALFDCVEASTDNSLISVDVSESGVPLIVFSNGSIFTFHVGMSSWIQVSTTNILGRLTTAISDTQLEISEKTGPLVRLLKRMRKQTTAPGVAPQVVKSIKESQLEQLLICAEQLGNPQDYQTMLMLYVETLCEGGSEKKLKNVLNTLSQSGAPMQVCGLRRAALFDDVTRLIKQRQPGIAERIVAGAATVTTSTKKSRTLF